MNWHALEENEVLLKLRTTRHGLTSEEARRRLELYGPNKLPKARPDSLVRIFLRQFKSPLIYILLVAAAVVFIMGEVVDAVVISTVLLINAAIGAFQEGKAQNTLFALESYVKTQATVARDERETVISDEFIVPGDIILLKEGDKIPADGRILDANAFRVDEAALTGESESVLKTVDPILTDDIIFAEETNMVFRGTYAVSGSSHAVVSSTGVETQIGKISKELKRIDTEIPLKANIRELSRLIIALTVLVAGLLFVLGIWRGIPVREMFATVVAISVSAIPEGLPVVVTLILAAGVFRMSKRNALVRKLQAVEALGQAQVIAVDKTGTLTLNQMMVEYLFANGTLYSVEGEGYKPEGQIVSPDGALEYKRHPHVLLAGKIAAFTASAAVAFSEKTNTWQRLYGDPTEAALLVFSQKIGFHRDDLFRESPQVQDIPFDSNTRYDAVINNVNDKHFLSVAGAPEVIIPMCSHIETNKGRKDISQKEIERIEEVIRDLSLKGLRVIALAYNSHPPAEISRENISKLTWVGLVAISDSLREEVPRALAKAKEAGIKVVMITGDHINTAITIAEKAGIWKKGDEVISGEEIENLTPSDLALRLPSISVFARVTPEHKLKIIESYRLRKDIVAMTGDGVNDALSLAAADLGVSMGIVGTEVAKEASDIILLDDNFGSIVSAVEEGRNIYATIKKVVLYLFSTSLGEILTITAAILLAFPLPVVASQIIWLNFVTDGFLVVALAMEPKEALHHEFTEKKKRNKIFDSSLVTRMILQAVTMMVGTVALFYIYLDGDYVKASTIALTTLAVYQWFNVWNCRTDYPSFKNKIEPNKGLYLATFIVILLHVAAVYVPAFQNVLRTTALSLFDWLLIILVSSSIIFVDLIWKIFHTATIPRNIPSPETTATPLSP
jgi:Ca2+-transporting ATPase